MNDVKIGDVVTIVWLDAALRTRIPKDDDIEPCMLLDTSCSYGEVIALDSTAICIIQNSNEETRDILTIPKSIIEQTIIHKDGEVL